MVRRVPGEHFKYYLLQKVLKLVPLKSTKLDFNVATMITTISDSYHYLVVTLNPIKSIKLKYHPGENIADLYD